MNTTSPYKWLVSLETGSIQKYVFETTRLREIRGASAILDEIGRIDMPDIITCDFAEIEEVRTAGGVAVLGATNHERLPELVARLKAVYAEKAPGISVYSAQVSCDGKAVAELLAEINYLTALAQGENPEADPLSIHLDSLVRHCDSCGKRPSEVRSKQGDEPEEWICAVCAAKREHGNSVRRGATKGSAIRRFAEHVSERDEWADVRVLDAMPDDLTRIGDTSHGTIGLILADGNRLGELLHRITDLDTYGRLSRGISDVVEKAVFDALAEFGPIQDKGERVLPWEIVYLGGDDILVVAAGKIALDVAIGIVDRVERYSESMLESVGMEGNRKRLTMACGVALAPDHFPIGSFYSLAYELEQQAKRKAYDISETGDESTIDFHRISSAGHTTLKYVRDSELTPVRTGGEDIRLTRRPFRVAELKRVMQIAESWRSSGLPRSKVHALYESLFLSPANGMFTYAQIVGRSSGKERDHWLQLDELSREFSAGSRVALPWIVHDTPSSCRDTYLLDLIDIWALDKK